MKMIRRYFGKIRNFVNLLFSNKKRISFALLFYYIRKKAIIFWDWRGRPLFIAIIFCLIIYYIMSSFIETINYAQLLVTETINSAWLRYNKLINAGDADTANIIAVQALEGFRNFFWGLSFLIASVFGLIFAGWRSWNHHVSTHAESKRIRLETFTNAVGQLGHDSPAIRIGAIQSLEQLSKMDRDFYPRVIETLCAFIRERRTIKPEPNEASEQTPDSAEDVSSKEHSKTETTPYREQPPVDIQLALTVLGRRERRWEKRGSIIDLRACQLRGADLSQGGWAEADFSNANLREAKFRDADLGRTNLKKADLKKADLVQADLRGAELWGADLRETDFLVANLKKADLGEANLEGAQLWAANLREADLGGVNLGRVKLGGVNLRGANLREANLREANLGGADLREAIGLTQEQIKEACEGPFDNPPTLPDGLSWHGQICERDKY